MKIKIFLLFTSFLLIAVIGKATIAPAKFIAPGNDRLSYMGRVQHTDSSANFNWTGTSVTLKVKATTSLKALLADDKGNNYYYVIIDGDGANARKIQVHKEKQWYTLVNNLTTEVHSIQLFRVTNTDFATTYFFGFEADANAAFLRPEKLPKRRIEFFGNSITCGHGVEVKPDSTDTGNPEFFNNYLAYSAITARHFKAQYHCTAKSGIGITISWFNEVMPDIYDRLDPKDSTSKWNFNLYTPDIVVVNLLQNDSWLVNMPDNPQFKARFGTVKPSEDVIITAYKNFIQSIRSKYPKAQIICCLGNMDATKEGSKWPGYIDTAVASLQDKKIVTHYFPYKKTDGHPKIKEQQAMADDLIDFIKSKGYWK